MDITIRELHSNKDIDDCIALQSRIWGLTEATRMSPVTLKAMSLDHPRMSYQIGAFLGDRMVAFQIIFATMEVGTVYGHMIGIEKEYRDHNIAHLMHQHLFALLRVQGMKRMVWTYEPLEGRNANNYIVKSGGTVIRYLPAHYADDVDAMSGGMPMDRFLMAVELDSPRVHDAMEGRFRREDVHELLAAHPVATAGNMPDTPAVLVRIPSDLQTLKRENLEEAVRVRLETRDIFTEYVNIRGFISERFVTGVVDGERHNYYVLHHPAR